MTTSLIKHPKRYAVKGIFFEVLSIEPVSEAFAREMVIRFYRSRKFGQKDKGKLFQVVLSSDPFS